MIVVDFAVGLVHIPVFERGIGPSGIGAGIRAIFRIGLIIEILDAGFVSVRAATPIVSSQRTLFTIDFVESLLRIENPTSPESNVSPSGLPTKSVMV